MENLESKLSPSQFRIGRLVALGYCNRDIAAELRTSEQAVKSSLHVMFDKLGVWNRVELVNFFKNNLTGTDSEVNSRFENNRLAAVRTLNLNDVQVDGQLDDLILLAAQICETPIALLTILEAHRLWFKAEKGMGVREVVRKASFCEHAAQGSEMFEVEDAASDARFRQHPLVVDNPRIRFYAGVPLIESSGYALGTLCVIDRVPRRMSEGQKSSLNSLSRIASALLRRKPKTARTCQHAGHIRTASYPDRLHR